MLCIQEVKTDNGMETGIYFPYKKKEQSVMERGGETKRLSGERASSQIPCPQPACPLCSCCCRPDGSLGAVGQMAGLDGGCAISAGRSGKRSSVLCCVIYCSPPGCQALQQHVGEKFTQGNEWVGVITRLPSLGIAEKNQSSVCPGPCEPPGSRQWPAVLLSTILPAAFASRGGRFSCPKPLWHLPSLT